MKKPYILAILGAVALFAAFWLKDLTPQADPALQAACEQVLGAQAPKFGNRCSEKAFAMALTGLNAQQTAQNIASANQSEILLNILQKFLFGFGAVLFLIGLLQLRRRKAK